MGVTQDTARDTTRDTQLPPPPQKKASRAEYARKRRANCGEVFRALREIKAIVERLESQS